MLQYYLLHGDIVDVKEFVCVHTFNAIWTSVHSIHLVRAVVNRA